MALHEIDPVCETPPAGKTTRIRIDWKRGAALLVAGETPDAVATALGITEERLWLHLRRSARFQFLLRQARETQLLLGRLQLEAASNAAAIRCARQAEKPPAGLFEQFKSTSQPAWEKPALSDGRDMVLRLADSLRRSARFQFLLRQARETQLLLGRLQLEAASNAAAIRCAQKAEKSPAGLFEQFKSSSTPAWAQPSASDGRDMVLRLADSLRRAPKRPPRAAKPAVDSDTPAVSPEKGAISKNKTHISENKGGISENKAATSPDNRAASAHRPAADADNALIARPAEAQPPSPARRAYDHVALGLQNGGIVDLTDLRGNPLPQHQDRHAREGGHPGCGPTGLPPSRERRDW